LPDKWPQNRVKRGSNAELRHFNRLVCLPRAGACAKMSKSDVRSRFTVENTFKIAALRRRKARHRKSPCPLLAVAEIREFARLALPMNVAGFKRFRFLQAVTDDFTAGGHRSSPSSASESACCAVYVI